MGKDNRSVAKTDAKQSIVDLFNNAANPVLKELDEKCGRQCNTIMTMPVGVNGYTLSWGLCYLPQYARYAVLGCYPAEPERKGTQDTLIRKHEDGTIDYRANDPDVIRRNTAPPCFAGVDPNDMSNFVLVRRIFVRKGGEVILLHDYGECGINKIG